MNTNLFQRRHIGPSKEEQATMLATIKAESLEQLIDETVPDNILLKEPLDLEPAMSEYQYCLLYTSPSPRDLSTSRMPSSA